MSNDLVDPFSVPLPRPQVVLAQGPEGAGYLAIDQDGTILMAPAPWRSYVGMSLPRLVAGGTFSLVEVLANGDKLIS